MRRSVFSLVVVLGLLLVFGFTTACKQPAPEPEVVEEIIEPAPVEEEAPVAEDEEEAVEEEEPAVH